MSALMLFSSALAAGPSSSRIRSADAPLLLITELASAEDEEVANTLARGDTTVVAGDVALAVFRRVDRFATILGGEIGVDSEESPVRLALGLYWRPFDVPLDVAGSLPIGLNDDSSKMCPIVLSIFEFPASSLARRQLGVIWNSTPVDLREMRAIV